jgi:hypothetical protein
MTPAGRFVPKVHPATRPAEADDPLEMHAIPLPGDPELMLRCVVEEYARAGWDAGQVLGLFEDPFFPALAGLRRHFGAAGLRERVTDLVGRTGVFQLRVTERAPPAPAPSGEAGPELVVLGIPASWRAPAGPGGSDHA